MSASKYPILDQLIRRGLPADANPDQLSMRLVLEAREIAKKIQLLPTSQEMEAMPELTFLADLAGFMNSEAFHPVEAQLSEHDNIFRRIFEDILHRVVYEFLKTRIFTNHSLIEVGDRLISRLVEFCSQRINEKGELPFKILRSILDKSMEFYKQNGCEHNLSMWGFGEYMGPDTSTTEFVDRLKNGDKIDCLRSANSQSAWIRATFDSIDGYSTKVFFYGDSNVSFVSDRYKDIRPVGTKSVDHEWREGLQVNDLVDFYSFRTRWILARIVRITNDNQVAGECVKTLEVRREIPGATDPSKTNYNQGGTSSSSLYDDASGLIKIRNHNPCLARPNTRSVQLLKNTDDSEDQNILALTSKPKWAILRPGTQSGMASVYFIRQMNNFGSFGGFDFVFSALDYTKTGNLLNFSRALYLLKNSTESLVSPLLQERGPQMVAYMFDFLNNYLDQNIRAVDKGDLTYLIEATTAVTLRLHSYVESNKIVLEMVTKVGLICFKSEILDKQVYGSRLINNYETLLKEAEYAAEAKRFCDGLLAEDVLPKLLNGHHELISKSASLYRMLIRENKLTTAHLRFLCEQIEKSHSDSKVALAKLAQEVTGSFSKEMNVEFLSLMLQHIEEATSEVIELVMTLRRIGYHQLDEAKAEELAIAILWKLIQSPREHKKTVVDELLKKFVELIKGDQLQSYLPKIVDGYIATSNKRNLKLLNNLLKSDLMMIREVCLFLKPELIDTCVNDHIRKLEALAQIKNPAILPKNEPARSQQELPIPIEDQTPEEIVKDVKRLIQFLETFVNSRVESENRLFHFEHFGRLLDAMLRLGLCETETMGFLSKYVEQLKMEDSIQKVKQFFETHVELLDKDSGQEFLPLFTNVLKSINIIENRLVKHWARMTELYSNAEKLREYLYCQENADTFFGIGHFWALYRRTTRKELFTQIGKELMWLYLPSEYCQDSESKVYNAQKQTLINTAHELLMDGSLLGAQKGSLLLMAIIKKEEAREPVQPVSMSQLKDGEYLTLRMQRDYGLDIRATQFKVNIYDNQTLSELKKAVLKSNNQLKSARITFRREDKTEIKNLDHFQTLEYLNIRDGALLFFENAEVTVANMIILNPDKTDFTGEVISAWKRLFAKYSANGVMTPELFARFTVIATDNHPCLPDEARVRGVFQRFGVSQTSMDETGFIDFYRDSATKDEKSETIVKQNLLCFEYDGEGKFKWEKEQHPSEILGGLTRVKLANDPDTFLQLIKLLSEDTITPTTLLTNYDFLKRLFSMLPPPTKFLNDALTDPSQFVAVSRNTFEFVQKVKIINGLLLRQELVKYVQNIWGPLLTAELEAFQAKILNASFLGVYAQKIREFLEKTPNCTGHPEFSMTLSFLAKILKGMVSLQGPDFLAVVKKMSNHFVGRQKKSAEKSAEKTQTDLQNPYLEGLQKPEAEAPSQEETETAMLQIMLTHLNLGQTLKDTISFGQLNETLLVVLKSLNKKHEDFNREMRHSMKWAASGLALSARLQPAQTLICIDSELFKETMVQGLKHPIMIWRNNFTNLYGILAHQFEDAKTKTEFLKTLISNIRTQGGDEFNNLVDLACSILADVGELKAKNVEFAEYIHREFNFLTLFSEFEEKLLSHQSVEKLFSDRSDQLLISYLAFLENILNADDNVLEQLLFQTKEKLVHFIFHDCLFQVVNNQIDFSNVKCHSKRSRNLAFALLRRLLKNNIRLNIHFMVKEISPLARHIPLMLAGQAVQSDSDRKFSSGYLGVRNLGCICYMIAVLQQFYCTPAFRYGILMGVDNVQPKMTEVKGVQIDDNFFHQFQKIMAYLDYSERKDFTPGEFCFSYKDYSGNPTNVSQQQDADEFLKIIADKIENALKKSPFLGVLNSVFMGKQCNIIKCKSCGYENIGEENFFNLSLEVKGMHNLAESFDRFINAETISDYMCDRCKVRREITKQAMLQSLPNVFIISLKKMVFDLDILINVKLHTHYEFPMELNLRKYMYQPKPTAAKPESPEEGMEIETEGAAQAPPPPLTDKDCEYKLVGVVIHQGNAEYGHYTSLINGNRGDPRRPDITTDKWYEFNDSRVSWFDMRKFQEECFGPAEEKVMSAYSTEPQTSKSAYVLVYEKVKKNDLVMTFTEEQTAEKELLLSNLIDPKNVRINGSEVATGFYNLNTYVPEPYKSEIWKDNCLLNAEQNLLSPDFTNTLASIFSDTSFGSGSQISKEERVYAETVLKNLPTLVSKIYCVAAESNRMVDIVNTIKKAFWVLSSTRGETPGEREAVDQKILNFYKEQIYANYDNFIKAITGMSDQNIAFGLIDYVSGIVGLTIKHFGLRAIEFRQNDDGSTESKANNIIFQTIYRLLYELTQIDSSSASIRKAQKVFQLGRKLANESPIIAHFLVQGNILGHMIDLYLKVDCSRTNPAEKSLAQLLQLVNDVFVFTRMNVPANPNFQAILDKTNKVDVLCKAVREDYKFEEFESLKRLTYTFLHGDQLATEIAISSILLVLPYSPEFEVLGPLEFFKACFFIDDSLVFYRTSLILGLPRPMEGNSWERDPYKNMFYGLARESSLKKQVHQYLSPFGQEKALLELICSNPSQYENNTMVMINYLIDFMLNFPAALNSVLFMPPHNYLSASFYDWFSVFCDHYLRGDTAASASYRSVMFNRKLNELPEKLSALENLIRSLKGEGIPPLANKKIFATGPNPYVTYDHPSSAEKEANSNQELWSIHSNYIVGKTLGYRILQNCVLFTNERGETLELTIALIRVALLPSHPTGHSNSAIPTALVSSDYSINTYTSTSQDTSEFMGISRSYFVDNSSEQMELEPIFHDSNDPLSVNPRPPVKPSPPPADYVKLAEPTKHHTSDYLLRVSLSNNTPKSFFVKVGMEGPAHINNLFGRFVTLIKGDKRDQLVQLLTLSHPGKTFEGLRIFANWKPTQLSSLRFYNDDYPQEQTDVFKFAQG